MRADWTAFGACISGWTAPLRDATRRAPGGIDMTSTRERAQNGRGCAAMIAAKREVVGPRGGSTAGALGAADWLSLAATPTFVLMAAVTGISGDREDAICLTPHEGSPLSGMTVM